MVWQNVRVQSPERNRPPVARIFLFVLLVAVPLSILVASIPSGHLIDEAIVDVVVLSAYGGVAGIVIFRRDGHLVGWLLLALGVTMLSVSRLEGLPGLPRSFDVLVSSVGWPLLFALFAMLTLTFPAGHLPVGNGRWARLGRTAGRWLLPVLVLVTLFSHGPMVEGPNPVGLLPGWVWYPAWAGVLLILVGGSVSLVVRRRKSAGVERAQLGWVALPLAFLAMAILFAAVWVLSAAITGAEDPGDGVWTIAYVVMLIFPIAFGIAVLRYRLYEIDRIISRTLTYGMVSAVLVAVYLGAVFILGNLAPLEGELAVAASTLLAAALFNPLRRTIQNSVDRRFNRSRFDTERTMEVLSRRLSNQVDLSELDRELRRVAGQTMQPDSVSVWVRETENPRPLRP